MPLSLPLSQRDLLLLQSPPVFLQTTTDSKTTLPQPTTNTQIFCLILLFTPLDLVVVKMPKWEEIRDDVFEAIIQVLPPISKEQQAEILAMLQAKGHVVTWNAVRYVLELRRLLAPEPERRGSTWRPLPEQVFGVAAWLRTLLLLLPSGFALLLFSHLPINFAFLSFSPASRQLYLHIQAHKITRMSETKRARRTLQTWDADTHQAILLALIDHIKPSGSDWSAVVETLRGKGYTFTEGALVYVFRRNSATRQAYLRPLFSGVPFNSLPPPSLPPTFFFLQHPRDFSLRSAILFAKFRSHSPIATNPLLLPRAKCPSNQPLGITKRIWLCFKP